MSLHLGDCREVMLGLEPGSVDACVCDPPYELGFMGKGWDRSGVAYDVSLWATVFELLKPGAHLMAFGGTRTYHRLACAVEDAGFEIRDSLHWIYGTGFPKSLNLDGDYKGTGTALKPAHEPIVMARKPFKGTVADCVCKHGTGGINVDGCRVAMSDKDRQTIEGGAGRWPPNIILSHAPDCGAICSEDCPVREIDRQGGEGVSTGGLTPKVGAGDGRVYSMSGKLPANAGGLGDSGGASRFFPVFRYEAKASRAEREAGCDGLPPKSAGECTDRTDGTAGLDSPRAGAGRTSGARNHHPTVKPIALMAWLVRLVTPAGGTVLDPFMGSGTTGIACHREGCGFIGIEREPEYFEIAKARIEAEQKQARLF